jgi:hypothetical protein
VADFPLKGRACMAGDRACIAVRDHVSPFEKWGSLMFSFSNLNACYGKVVYLTQNSRGDKRKVFHDSLEKLLRDFKQVDVYILAHGNNYFSWVPEQDSSGRKGLHVIYNTGCGNYYQQKEWRSTGARIYVSHRGNQSLSPVFYFYYLRRLECFSDIKKTVGESNGLMVTHLKRLEWITFGALSLTTDAEESKAEINYYDREEL